MIRRLLIRFCAGKAFVITSRFGSVGGLLEVAAAKAYNEYVDFNLVLKNKFSSFHENVCLTYQAAIERLPDIIQPVRPSSAPQPFRSMSQFNDVAIMNSSARSQSVLKTQNPTQTLPFEH